MNESLVWERLSMSEVGGSYSPAFPVTRATRRIPGHAPRLRQPPCRQALRVLIQTFFFFPLTLERSFTLDKH
jgi:hypothetical protein